MSSSALPWAPRGDRAGPAVPPGRPARRPRPVGRADVVPPSTLPLTRSTLGRPPANKPLVTNVQIVDLDRDGLPDVLACDAVLNRVVWYRQAPRGAWEERVLGDADLPAPCHVCVADLNGDGRPDLLLTGGDKLEITYNSPQPWHGCILLENQGGWRFTPRRIATVPGVYAAGVGDLNGDGHPDVVLVSMFNDWRRKGSASVVWLENDGKGNFTPWQIADAPSHLATVAVGDLDGDGRADIVAGSLHVLGPFDRLGRVTLWTSGGRR